MNNYSLARYPKPCSKRWAIFDAVSRCFVLFGKKRDLEKRLTELNKKESQ